MIDPESSEDLSRRQFLKIGAVFLTSLASGYAPALTHANVEPQYLVDLDSALKNELKESRAAPQLLSGLGGKRFDFNQHTNRPIGLPSTGGLDFNPVSYTTEIVPAVSGYVITIRDDHPVSGMLLTLFHPFGYTANYAHLDSRYIRFGKVERNDIMAVMGRSGSGATAGRVHLHFTLIGPAYTKYLSGVKVQKISGDNDVLDPEEFSISGKGKELPYQRLSDREFDDALWKKHFEAEKYLEGVLREFPKNQVQISPRKFLEDTFHIRGIDREIDFIYSAILSGKHPFSKNDEEKVLRTLHEYMRQVPRLTAPIKELEREGDYNYINKEPVKVYGK